MTPPKKRKLQLVPYAPDNYKPGEVLAQSDSTILKTVETIGAALSLYFQWEKKRSSHISFSQGAEKKALLCRMDYDHDEASPSEIRVQLQKSKIGLKIVPGTAVLIRFEIFRVTYEFKSIVSATSNDPKIEGWHSIIEVPEELRVIKSRSLPRVKLKAETRKLLPKAEWQSADKNVKIPLKLLEVGMGSVRAACQSAPEEKGGHLLLGTAAIPVEIVRLGDSEIVFKLKFKDHSDFGAYFDYYRLVAYPSLRSRYEIPFEEGIELYKKSNYFGVFKAEKSREQLNELMHTWAAIKSGLHSTNADYYVVDDAKKPVGSSGLALACMAGNQHIWFFHQLCAIKNPDLVERSGILYTWRAEYLAAHFGAISANGTFYSKSRWLERIYVKHCQNTDSSTMRPVMSRRAVFFKEKSKVKGGITRYQIGSMERFSTVSTDLWGCASPRFLNANETLDMIVAIFRDTSDEEIENLGSALAKRLKKESLSLFLSLKHDHVFTSLKSDPQRSDRFFQIPKVDLVVFLSSVEHSVAVTERKLQYATL
jgi:hypothetical protein